MRVLDLGPQPFFLSCGNTPVLRLIWLIFCPGWKLTLLEGLDRMLVGWIVRAGL